MAVFGLGVHHVMNRQEGFDGDGIETAAGLAEFLRKSLATHDRFVVLMKIRGIIRKKTLDSRCPSFDPWDTPCDVRMVVNVAFKVFEKRTETKNG